MPKLTDEEIALMTPMKKRSGGHEGFIWDAAMHQPLLNELKERGLIKYVERTDYSDIWVLTKHGYQALEDNS
jgi:hypothetical protein